MKPWQTMALLSVSLGLIIGGLSALVPSWQLAFVCAGVFVIVFTGRKIL